MAQVLCISQQYVLYVLLPHSTFCIYYQLVLLLLLLIVVVVVVVVVVKHILLLLHVSSKFHIIIFVNIHVKIKNNT